eukprot:TRINITY_DN7481_c0_g2_i4.p1 TRINITY_DN7481_c0_g2~~TRINITY_DN7481_c0_g2_i4.p1  ORF type:complete len:434 (-),score=77.30 TRINITY_DN7481_c0_g2_i4:97-1398(-)
MYSTGRRYLRSAYNWFEIIFYWLAWSIFALEIRSRIEGQDIDWSSTTSFINLTHLAMIWNWELALISIMLIIVWLKFLQYVSIFKQMSRLLVIIHMMLRQLKSFFVLLAIVLGAFASAEHVAFNYRQPYSNTWFYSLINRLSRTFVGVEIVDSTGIDRALGTLLAILFALLVPLLLMNLLIALLTTAYEAASREVGDAFWAKHQYRAINNDSRKDSLLRHFSLDFEQYFIPAPKIPASSSNLPSSAQSHHAPTRSPKLDLSLKYPLTLRDFLNVFFASSIVARCLFCCCFNRRVRRCYGQSELEDPEKQDKELNPQPVGDSQANQGGAAERVGVAVEAEGRAADEKQEEEKQEEEKQEEEKQEEEKQEEEKQEEEKQEEEKQEEEKQAEGERNRASVSDQTQIELVSLSVEGGGSHQRDIIAQSDEKDEKKSD